MVTRTWLDQAIGWFSPAAEERRIRARARTEIISRRLYDGAARPGRGDGFLRAQRGADPNAAIGASASVLRNAARDLVRNNPTVALSIEDWETHAAPMSVRAQVDEKDPAKSRPMNERIDTAWWEWSLEADFNEVTDFEGLQRIVVRELIEAGGCLVHRKLEDRTSKRVIPMQVQLLEIDYLDTGRDREKPEGGGFIMGGIQFNAAGRRTGYWIHRQHPGGMSWSGVTGGSYFVPADDMLLIFDPLRAGQQTGVTRMATVLQRARDMGIYEEAELVRKNTEACLVGSVEDPNADLDAVAAGECTLTPAVTDADGNRIEEFAPGMFMYPAPGRKISFHQPTANGGYAEYIRTGDRRVAAGIGTTYERHTGDYSQVNYSSARLGDNGFRRRVEKLQNKVLVPQFLRPVFHRWWLPLAVLKGVAPDVRTWSKWSPPRWDSINPVDDARADLINMRSGVATLPQVLASHGLDPVDQVLELGEFNKLCDEHGVILDSDPRHRTSAGNPADTAAAEASSAPDGGAKGADGPGPGGG